MSLVYSHRTFFSMAGMLLLWSLRLFAQEAVKLQDVELPIEKQQTSAEVVFPAIKGIPGKIPVLKARIFFNSPNPAGWNNCTSIVLNGKQLGRYTSTGNDRLLRRGEYMEATIESRRDWWSNINGLLVLFGPGDGNLDKRIIRPRDEGYWYYLDISDLVNYIEYGLDDRVESAKENHLVLINGLAARTAGNLLFPLTFKDMEIIHIPEGEAAALRPETPIIAVGEAPVLHRADNGGTHLDITEGGGLVLERNGEKYYWSAAFSYPAKPAMLFDRLSPEKSDGRPGWKATVAQSGESITVKAATDDRRLERTIRFAGEFVEVTDAVTNLSQAESGLLSRFTAISKDRLSPDAFYLAGLQGVSRETGCGANPTLYLRGKSTGFGAMALDAAFRCHLELLKTSANSAEIHNPTALKPGETYCQKYLLILTDKADYFAFLNALRQHLKLNRTINGPAGLGIRVIDRSKQMRIVTETFHTHWFEYGSLKALAQPRAEYKELFNRGREQYRKMYPGIKVLGMVEMSPLFVDKRTIEGADRLPSSGKALSGVYGQPISAEATEVIDKATPYGDSILRTQEGHAIIDTFYPGDPILSLLVYPYNGNFCEKRLFDQADFLLDDVQADGIYIDQFANGSMYAVSSGKDRISYDRWDGRTVELNPDGTVARKLFDLAYACAPTRIRYIRKVLDKGKVFLANTHPVTTEEADAGGLRFSESDSENLAPTVTSTGKPGLFRMQTLSQLSPSPLVLGMRPARFSQERERWARMYNRAFICGLRHGILYCHYGISTSLDCYALVNHMFPITPVKLGEGFIIGEERILTAVSREFVTATKPLKILGFDAEGKGMENAATLEQLPDGQWKTSVTLDDWNSSCVILLSGPATPFDELD